jgi:fatty-acyl-CoA synthase
MSPQYASAPTVNSAELPAQSKPSVAKAWVRALELTAQIARRPDRILPALIDERASDGGDAMALASDDHSLTYAALAAQSRRYMRWARSEGLDRGQVVALLMPNCPEYVALWLGITRAGGIVALLNTNLAGAALAHCINVAAPAHLIVSADLSSAVQTAAVHVTGAPKVWSIGQGHAHWPALDVALQAQSGDPLDSAERVPVTIDDTALYIYTSGTTGLPKAAKVSHGRIMQWSHWFAGLTAATADDRLYNCLPLYHSVGGVLATGAMLVAGGSVVIRDKFSARQFWSDVVRWDCTVVQYIGELCRYLLHAPPTPHDRGHRIRLCCGNGLRPEVWTAFATRFGIPQILEFYASTEGNVSLFNVDGRPGAVGRIPPFLAHRFPASLVRFDFERGEPTRDERGFCVRCGADETGELLGKILSDRANVGGRFDGYTDAEASAAKILRNVFEPGDAWFRSGDLLRQDDRGFFYFVDRVGDTFRWKGENVATSEVSQTICEFAGVRDAVVYGVPVPHAEGRVAMAAIVADAPFDFGGFRRHLTDHLPSYARPAFLRFRSELDATATFKSTTRALAEEGFDPAVVHDQIFVDNRTEWVPLDADVFAGIQAGLIRF